MASLILRNAQDPFAIARELFSQEVFPTRTVTKFSPSFNVMEREDAFYISADIPGVKEDDLEITIDKGMLTVSGARKPEESKDGDNYHVFERRSGSFARTFSLPDGTNADGIVAKLADGVLEVIVPKKAKILPRKIALTR